MYGYKGRHISSSSRLSHDPVPGLPPGVNLSGNLALGKGHRYSPSSPQPASTLVAFWHSVYAPSVRLLPEPENTITRPSGRLVHVGYQRSSAI